MIEKQLFSKEECDFILRQFQDSEWNPSLIGQSGKGGYVPSLRESQTRLLNTKDNPKLSELLLNKLSEFNVVKLPAIIQLLRYEVGGYFRKHRDTMAKIKVIIITSFNYNYLSK